MVVGSGAAGWFNVFGFWFVVDMMIALPTTN
jgi:hypothetical protein